MNCNTLTNSWLRRGDKIHRPTCRYAPGASPWSYADGFSAEDIRDELERYPWLTACGSCHPTRGDTCCLVGCDRATAQRGYCDLHYQRIVKHGDPGPVEPIRKPFWDSVDVGHPLGCWEWTSHRDRHGYGRSAGFAHRLAYEQLVGPIPDGMQLDHLCRNRGCVNPDHLEPVTALENTRRSPLSVSQRNRRKTHCIRGHAFTSENTYVDAKGRRNCRECMRVHDRRYRAAKRAAS